VDQETIAIDWEAWCKENAPQMWALIYNSDRTPLATSLSVDKAQLTKLINSQRKSKSSMEARSADLADQGKIPSSFSARTITNAQKGKKIEARKIISIAIMLEASPDQLLTNNKFRTTQPQPAPASPNSHSGVTVRKHAMRASKGLGLYMIAILVLVVLCALVGWKSIDRASRILTAEVGQIPLRKSNLKSLLNTKERLNLSCIQDLSSLDEGAETLTAWSTTQAYLAVRDEIDDIMVPKLLNYIEAKKLLDCGCWAELNSEKSEDAWNFISGWILFAYAKAGIKNDGLVNNILYLQSRGAWASSYKYRSQEYQSTYSTAWILLGLKAYYKASLTNDEILNNRMKNSIRDAERWLYLKKEGGSLWRLYPNIRKNRVSMSISGLVIYALNVEPASEYQEISRLWVNSLKGEIYSVGESERPHVEIYDEKGAVALIDDFTYIVLPWMTLATLESYNDLDFWGKFTALSWLESNINQNSMQSADKDFNNWWRAELLFSLNEVAKKAIYLQ